MVVPMSLRYPVIIRRRAAGSWVAGRWVVGALGGMQTILTSVQPAVRADYDMMEPRLEGRRVEAMVRVYTAERLQVAGEEPAASGDVVTWQGQDYEFVAVSVWQSGILPHFRYLAARLIDPR